MFCQMRAGRNFLCLDPEVLTSPVRLFMQRAQEVKTTLETETEALCITTVKRVLRMLYRIIIILHMLTMTEAATTEQTPGIINLILAMGEQTLMVLATRLILVYLLRHLLKAIMGLRLPFQLLVLIILVLDTIVPRLLLLAAICTDMILTATTLFLLHHLTSTILPSIRHIPMFRILILDTRHLRRIRTLPSMTILLPMAAILVQIPTILDTLVPLLILLLFLLLTTATLNLILLIFLITTPVLPLGTDLTMVKDFLMQENLAGVVPTEMAIAVQKANIAAKMGYRTSRLP
jgi:hypothetical protein